MSARRASGVLILLAPLLAGAGTAMVPFYIPAEASSESLIAAADPASIAPTGPSWSCTV